MGVYIKDMEMPTRCYTCPCADLEFLDCNLMPGTRIEQHKRLDDCPLVPVPPHGRLGDLDELNEKHDKLSRDFCHGYFKNTWDFVCAARELFYDAPTIIEAEEGET